MAQIHTDQIENRVAQRPRLCFDARKMSPSEGAIPSAGDPGSPDRAGFARAGVAKRGICSAAVRISRIPLPLVMLSEHERPRGASRNIPGMPGY